jgi:hypothetical protein
LNAHSILITNSTIVNGIFLYSYHNPKPLISIQGCHWLASDFSHSKIG